MYSTNNFNRDLAIATFREFKDPNLRKQKVNALYAKFDASEVWFDGRMIGWRVGSDFICFKKRYKTEADARLIVSMGSVRSRGRHKATDVYHCQKCDGWHATSKGPLAGTYKLNA